MINFIPYWLTLGWWKFIFEPRNDQNEIWIWQVWLCRWRGHPAGVYWYNSSGWNPDMTCRNCGDDLG